MNLTSPTSTSHLRRFAALAVLALLAGVANSSDARADVGLATQPGVTDSSAGVPESGNQTSSAIMASTAVDESTGMMHTSIAIASPPARGGAQPGLSVSYGSEGGPGYAGFGWDLDVPRIERRALSGPPSYEPLPTTPVNWQQRDMFYFGGSRLVPIGLVQNGACLNSEPGEVFPGKVNNWWYFRQEVDGAFARFFLSPDQRTWLVQSSGVTMELGQPLASRAAMPAALLPAAVELSPGSANPYRWYVVRKYDAQEDLGFPTNVVYYVWLAENGLAVQAPDSRLYLSHVFDTPRATLPVSAPPSYGDFAHHIALQYESPSWTPATAFHAPIHRQIPYKRLSNVAVTSARFGDPSKRELVRRYHFRYHEARLRSYLDSVAVEGRCAAPVYEADTTQNPMLPAALCLPLQPATSFSYEGATAEAVWLPTPLIGNLPATPYLADINTDGLPDFVATAAESSDGKTWSASVGLTGTLAPDNVSVSARISSTTFVAPSAGFASTFNAGQYLANGSLNVAMLSGTADPLIYQDSVKSTPASLNVFTPAGSGVNWTWTAAPSATLDLTRKQRSNAVSVCDQAHTGWTIPYVSDEVPYGTGDIDGDSFPDLLTYTVLAHLVCTDEMVPSPIPGHPNVEAWDWLPDFSTTAHPSITIAIAMRQTTRQSNGVVSSFNSLLGSTPPPAEWAALLPSAMRYLKIASSDPTVTTHLIPEDLNGDGLVDLLNVAASGITVAFGRGDGTLQTAAGVPYAVTTPTLPLTDPSSVYFHDLNGDGLSDIVSVSDTGIAFLINRDGLNFESIVSQSVPGNVPQWTGAKNAQVTFADMNGSGVDDLVVIQKDVSRAWYADFLRGERPGLLKTIANGQGAVTTIKYATTTALSSQAVQAGVPWARQMGQVLHHVTSISTTNGLYAPYAQTRTTQYAYRDPMYNARDSQFIGFRTVRKTEVGAGDDPSLATDTTYLSGVCEIDSGINCPVAPFDRPFLALAGRPKLVETSDGKGTYLSTVHTTWDVTAVTRGGDGRFGRFAYPHQVDTYLYDTASPAASTSTQTLDDACFSDRDRCLSFGPVTLHGSSSQYVHLQQWQLRDAHGNVIRNSDYGVVGVDQQISTYSTWDRPPGDTTGWLWRKMTDSVTPFTNPGAAFPDQPHSTIYGYDFAGNLTTVTSALTGGVNVQRSDARNRTVAATPAIASANSPAVVQSTSFYDKWGNQYRALGARGASCAEVSFDDTYKLVAVAQRVYTQVSSPSSCSGPRVTTSASYDIGFAAPTTVTAPDLSYTMTSYDGFGRVQTITKNDTNAPVLLATQPSIITTYVDYAPPRVSVPYVQTLTWDGGAYRTSISVVDGMGASIAAYKQAAASDAPYKWIVSGVVARGARGHVLDQYQNFFIYTDPLSNLLGQVIGSVASRHTKYDAFGRATLTRGLDGNQDSANVYHALWTEAYDALNLPAVVDHPAYTFTYKDGHGRTTHTDVRGKVGSAANPTIASTSYAYTVSGKVTVLTRSNLSGGASPVVQNLKYDSFDRLVENQEPNTTRGSSDWRYVYDDDGNLVATSDPRGCGENIAYDAAGRKLTEDFSPCLADHPDYTPLTGGANGAEVYYAYDAPVGTTAAVPDGRLYAVMDRAQATFNQFDSRGRTTHVDRRIASPSGPSSVVFTSYAKNAFSYDVTYDDADRVTWHSTGASAPGMLVGGKSGVAIHYDERGHVQSLDGSYGPLLTATQFDADGLPMQYKYGDAAKTTSVFKYDNQRRLFRSTTSRPAKWAASPAPTDTRTEESVLEDLTVLYDAVGNPKTITDLSDATSQAYPTAWPNGAKPIHKKQIGYDDLYHVTSVDYDTGGDTFTQPFEREFTAENAGSPLGSNGSPVPATVLAARVTSQRFNYDWLGNTTASDDHDHAFYDRSLGTITNDTFGPNRLSAATGPGGSLSVTYDIAGYVTNVYLARSGACVIAGKCAGEQFSYSWNEVGQLVRARRWDQIPPPNHLQSGPPAVDTTYAYDSGGARVLKATSVNGQSATYGAEVFSTLRLENATWDATRNQYKDDETTEGVYLAGPTSGIARLAYSTSDPRTLTSGNLHVFFELKDVLGSSSFVIDRDTSELVERTTYQPYGAVESDMRTARWESFREPYKFGGKEADVGVGVSYFGGRYYAPELGRWMSADPVAIHAQAGNLNPYAYASGRVFKVTDPTGLYDESNPYGSTDDWNSPYALGVATMNGIPGSDTMMALALQWNASDPMNSYMNGFSNSLSDPINGASHFFGGADLVPTFAPGPSTSNAFDAMAYGAGGATGITIATEGLGINKAIGSAVAGAVGWVEGAGEVAPVMASVLTKVVPDVGDVAANAAPAVATAEVAADGAGAGASFAADAHPTFAPGPYAGASIPARSASQVFTTGERVAINDAMAETGCHTCGIKTPGTVSGNAIPDHQPVSALNFANAPQRLYPQCLQCSKEQGLAVARALRALGASE